MTQPVSTRVELVSIGLMYAMLALPFIGGMVTEQRVYLMLAGAFVGLVGLAIRLIASRLETVDAARASGHQGLVVFRRGSRIVMMHDSLSVVLFLACMTSFLATMGIYYHVMQN
jgi:hypothetical protein